MDLYDKLTWVAIGLLVLAPPLISAVRYKRRQDLFLRLAEEYGLHATINRVPFWKFASGFDTVELQQLSGSLSGTDIEVSDILSFGFRPGFLGFRYFFYIEPWWGASTQLRVGGKETTTGNWRGLASGRRIRASLDRLKHTERSG